MIRYRLSSVDPLDDGDRREVGGTYPLSVAKELIAACYADPNCLHIPVAMPVKIKPGRHTYYVEAAGRRWFVVADSPSQAAREAARRGVPARVWFCRDDHTAGCVPLVEIRRVVS